MKSTSHLETLRHSTSHVLAAAVKNLYPNAKLGIGPAIENGFYYDFGNIKISDEDLPKIEKEMEKIISQKLPFVRKEISVGEAREIFQDQPYKLQLIDELEKSQISNLKSQISIYKTGEFVDLCKGPHIKDASAIKAFKLTHIAGAYWKGNEKNPMLTRIYGTAFETPKELEHYLWQQEEAKKRDHRKIGKELDLFSFHPAAPGDVFWHPKGYTIVKELYKYWREIHEREGYVEVRTPEILTHETWDQSGHTTFFIKKMYKVTTPDAEEWNMAVKPMNCDGGILIYKSKIRSYKEFPLRMGELGVVHRYESSGELHGILRPREFTQDDAHIYCTPDQVKNELKRVMDLCFEVYETFGLDLDHLELSTRPEKSIGSDEVWERAESIMREVLKEKKVPHQINEGEGAFYGPKFDFHLRDSLGRTWQCSTIQLDFAQPENFDLNYVTEKGTQERPVMIHRVLYGSIERFLGIVIEFHTGNFPVWLSPVQAIIVPIADRHLKYAQKTLNSLKSQNLRADLDNRDETMQAKIRDAQLQKIPYMLIVGDKEEKAGTVSERGRSGKDYGQIKVDEFIANIKKEIEEKVID